MAAFIAKLVSKKILGEKIENRFGKEDPYFEQVPATRLDGTPNGKFKKVRKALPPGISDHDGKVLTKVKRRAWRLDMSLFNCCGVRFGWSSAIGIVPAIGDALDAFMAMMVVHTCRQVDGGLPQAVLSQMYFNVILDFVIGLVPFVGDIADAAFRANTRNAIVLEEHLRKKGQKTLRQSGLPVPEVDPSDPHDFDRIQSGTPPEYTETQPGRNGNMTAARNTHNTHRPQSTGVTASNTAPSRPAEARVHDDRGSKRGFFGFGGSKKSRPTDVEMGQANNDPARKSSRRG